MNPDTKTAPPWSDQAERSLLSMCLLAPGNILPTLIRQGAQEAFYREAHQCLFRQISACYETGKLDGGAIALPVLAEKMRAVGDLEKIRGEHGIAELASWEPGAEGWQHRWEIVRDFALRRRAAAVGDALRASALDVTRPVEEVMSEAETSLFSLHAGRSDNSPQPAARYAGEAMDHLQMLIRNKGMILGAPTGITELDQMLGGLQPKKFYVIAARPGVGKTVLEQVIAENISEGKGHYQEMGRMREVGIAAPTPALIISLEVDGCQLALRRILANTQTGLTLLRTGFFPRGWQGEIAAPAARRIADSALWIWDAHDLNISALRAEVRRWMREVVDKHAFPPNRPSHLPRAVVCVDHIGLLQGSSNAKKAGKTAEVTEISQQLMHLAKELSIPVIALSQLNRETEKKGSGRPSLANLRDSGAIEQDADVAMLLLRPRDYDKETDYTIRDNPENRIDPESDYWTPPGPRIPGYERRCELLKLIVAKHRGGPTGDIDLAWEGPITQIHSLTPCLYSNDETQRKHTV